MYVNEYIFQLMKDGIAEDNDKGESVKNGRLPADMEELKVLYL